MLKNLLIAYLGYQFIKSQGWLGKAVGEELGFAGYSMDMEHPPQPSAPHHMARIDLSKQGRIPGVTAGKPAQQTVLKNMKDVGPAMVQKPSASVTVLRTLPQAPQALKAPQSFGIPRGWNPPQRVVRQKGGLTQALSRFQKKAPPRPAQNSLSQVLQKARKARKAALSSSLGGPLSQAMSRFRIPPAPPRLQPVQKNVLSRFASMRKPFR